MSVRDVSHHTRLSVVVCVVLISDAMLRRHLVSNKLIHVIACHKLLHVIACHKLLFIAS